MAKLKPGNIKRGFIAMLLRPSEILIAVAVT
jgi:hypothetical protein